MEINQSSMMKYIFLVSLILKIGSSAPSVPWYFLEESPPDDFQNQNIHYAPLLVNYESENYDYDPDSQKLIAMADGNGMNETNSNS